MPFCYVPAFTDDAIGIAKEAGRNNEKTGIAKKHVPEEQGEVTSDTVARSPVPTEFKLFYRLYGHGDTKVLLIMGLAGTHHAWAPQLEALCGTDVANDEEQEKDNMVSSNAEEGENEGRRSTSAQVGSCGRQCCAYDNRGVGQSSIPRRREAYSTTSMARDALALMDHLRWAKAHVFGHSMGGMIACKLAAMAPTRIASLAIISSSAGGYACIPKWSLRILAIAYRLLRAKTPEARAAVDLDTHYTSLYLDAVAEAGETRRAVLYKEYVQAITASGMQERHGQDGHMHACWTHFLTGEEWHAICSGAFLVSVIHGNGDIICPIERGMDIAKRLGEVAKFVDLPGGHFITRECQVEVNDCLLRLIMAVESGVAALEWSQTTRQMLGPEGWSQSRQNAEASASCWWPQFRSQSLTYGKTNLLCEVESAELRQRTRFSNLTVCLFILLGSLALKILLDVILVNAS
ncbi:hypothetical protein CBR_g52250 [Chara braunii]|uniref:AB hydrolase-1 domain-containing protein n=1 Tax=Chara braunii TaxID=69332 RepID=A0A388MA47_CHABU|nr:hypothetical protein CBR_g52250 [Chara braunii]|eukprot:GBG91363.1 hypothetical protein CBR_g52250 [Chara braunii]